MPTTRFDGSDRALQKPDATVGMPLAASWRLPQDDCMAALPFAGRT